MSNPVIASPPWSALKRFTPARVALGRAGGSLRTDALLDLRLAHAQARDALLRPLDEETLVRRLEQVSEGPVLRLQSQADSLDTFLLRPDLGRVLDVSSATQLVPLASSPVDLLITVSEGLSTIAVESHAPPLLETLWPLLREDGWHVGPVCLVRHGRVAVQDHVGECAKARFALILVGERPGLAAPDSLGAYLVRSPRRGNTDADRNCLSNIHRRGLAPADAAVRLAWLLSEARKRQLTGVQLKLEFPSTIPQLSSSPPV